MMVGFGSETGRAQENNLKLIATKKAGFHSELTHWARQTQGNDLVSWPSGRSRRSVRISSTGEKGGGAGVRENKKKKATFSHQKVGL